jgi:hypothetical protein
MILTWERTLAAAGALEHTKWMAPTRSPYLEKARENERSLRVGCVGSGYMPMFLAKLCVMIISKPCEQNALARQRYIHMYIYIYTYIHISMYTHTYTHAHICI